jgi:competence ComEA-like helix-hairpin-helix protein
MTNISLRSYTREIEKLIDSSQADQAIAHCRHILKSYPKCVDAYRLLGKAYLESQRYGDAADIFQRVLSSVPDDFVSQVGMSLIREDEGNLDQAIWHMERAFEVQPANAAIQGELRRLYGRRDGMEPPKIRLTRGALARMYARGELFQQAVAEIRNALAEDPNRLDLITLLASVYAQAGQKAEAVEMCNGLLRKLPYSLEGNRIMSDMLKDTDRVQDLQVYKRRLVALNPYFGQLSPAAPSIERVPDQSVTFERLQWTPGMVVEGPSSQPEWAASLGVQLTGMTSEKDILPDWLMNLEGSAGEMGKSISTGEGDKSASPFDNNSLMEFARETQKTEPAAGKNAEASTKPLKPSPEESIPEWMKEAGWEPASGEAIEGESHPLFPGEEDFLAATASNSGAAGESGLVEANIPDWLQAMAPEDEQKQDASQASGDDLAWLDSLQGEPPAAQIEGEADQELDWLPDSKVEVPDWLKDLDEETSTEGEPPAKPLTELSPQAEAESEEKLQEAALDQDVTGEASQEGVPVEPESAESMPDWLMEGMRGPDARAAGPSSSPQAQEEPISGSDEDIPDWLRDFAPEDEAAPASESASLDETPDWLQSVASDEKEVEGPAPEEISGLAEAAVEGTGEAQEAPAAEIPSTPAEDEMPGEKGAEPQAEAEVEAQAESEPAGQAGAGEIPAAPPEEEAPAWDIEGADDAFAWLEGLAVKQGAEEALLLNAEDRKESPPDWVKADSETPPAEEEQAEIPEWLQELGPQGAQETGSEEPAAEAPDWVKSAAELGTPETPGEEAEFDQGTSGEAEPAEIPDWLQSLEPEEQAAEEGEPEASEAESKAPEWISQAPETPVDEGQLEEEAVGEAEPAEIPDWLQSLEPQEQAPEEVELEAPEVESQAPEWISQAPETPADEGQLEEEAVGEAEPAEIPAWLQSLEPEEQAAEEGEPVAPEVESEAPEWVGEAPEMPAGEVHLEEETLGEAEPAEIPDWLQSLEPQDQAPEEVELEAPQAESQAPEWVSEAPEMPAGEVQFEEEAVGEAEPAEIPDWLQSLEPQSDELEETQVEAQADLEGDWFSEGPPILGDTQPVKVGGSAQAPAQQAEAAPGAEAQEEVETGAEATIEMEAETGPASEAEVSFAEKLPEALEGAPEFGQEAEAAQLGSEEREEEPAAASDEWQLEEPEAAPSEEVASMLSETQASDDAFAWLESLAIRQGADEALVLKPEDRSETPPDWVKAEIEEAEEEGFQPEAEQQPPADFEPPADLEPPAQEPIEAIESGQAVEEFPAGEEILPEESAAMELEARAEEERPQEPTPEPESQVAEEEAPAWMEEEQMAAEEQPSEALEPEAEAEAHEEIPELPDWLQEGPAESVEEAAWTPPAMQEKLDLNQASLVELERLPDIGFRMAQSIVNYRDANGAFNSVDDLLNIPGLGPEILSDIRDWLYITPAPEESAEEMAFPPADFEAAEGPAELMEARAHISNGDMQGAAESYTQIIKSNQHLETIIQDLQAATQLHPGAIHLWQALGDAHLRAGQIQMALDAYSQAEKLLS